MTQHRLEQKYAISILQYTLLAEKLPISMTYATYIKIQAMILSLQIRWYY